MILNTNEEKSWECRLENAQSFYPTMLEWAKQHNFNIVPIELMPWDVFVLKEKGKDVYCTSLFVADHLAFTVFPLGNKKVETTAGGLGFVFKTIEKYCKKLDIHILATTVGETKYKRFLEKVGWSCTGLVCEDHYMKIIT
jgi:hypothetical protein